MRPFPAALLVGALLSTLGLAGCLMPAAGTAPLGAVKEFWLTAQETQVELWPGHTVAMWTYNGQVPGPLLRVTEGDQVVVHFQNNHTLPHTVHFHGDHPFGMDGMDEMAVPPGGSFTYRFTAGTPGAYVYHCHVDTPVHIPMGLYGQFVIDPKDGWPGEKPDHEYFAVFSGWNPNHNLSAETHMINGKAYPLTQPFQAKVGERVRLFITSFDEEPVAVHLHGALSQQVWPGTQPIDVIPLAHAETRVVDYVTNEPGVWMMHDHYERHLRNDGAYPGGSLTALEIGEPYWGKFAAGHAHGGQDAAPPSPDEVANGTAVHVMDYKFAPGAITVKAGTTVVWTNHGQAGHTVTSDEKDGPLRSALLAPGQSYAYTFDKPGTYRYHCAPHSAKGQDGAWAGMLGTVVVTP